MRAITINTYAGSLLIAAKAANLEVDASLEDSKFGVNIQSMNFPGLRIFTNPTSWPKLDLSDHVVIAHPPCSAFSVQNNSASRKGTGSDAFACTVQVLDYSMKNRARVILIESVIGAMEGAREVHDKFAEEKGYVVYRFLVNSASFGVPQWRPRFWAAWVRKDIDMPTTDWPVDFQPKYVRLRDVLFSDEERQHAHVDCQVEAPYKKQVEAWDRESVDPQLRDDLLNGRRGFGLLNTLITVSKDYDKWAPRGFRSKHLRMLDPDGMAPTLLLDSGWLLPGRRLCVKEYFRIMGFPDDYKMPQQYLRTQFKMYLSKGVCPPVAQWFLEQAKYWFGHSVQFTTRAFANGEALDLRPSDKKSVPYA